MRLSNPTFIPLLVILLSLLSISPTTTTTAAPSPQPPAPAPAPAGETPVDKCGDCLARELRSIPKCDSLSSTTPAPPQNDRDPAEIKDYKDKNPDVVACLCLAAKWTEEPVDWISKCDKVCMADVTKKEKKVLKDFEARLSCNGGSGDSGEGKGKSDGGGGSPPSAAAAAAFPSKAAAQPATVAPPVQKPASVAAVPQTKPGANTAPAANAIAPKSKEFATNKPDPKPAAASPSNNSPNARDIKAGEEAKPAF